MGVQDTITTAGWTTSYTSIMRVLPTKKSIATGKKKKKIEYINKNLYPGVFDITAGDVGASGNPISKLDYSDILKQYSIGYQTKDQDQKFKISFDVMEYQYQGYKLDRPHICTSLGDEETLQSIEGLAYAYALTKTIAVSGMLNINKDNSKQIPMEKSSDVNPLLPIPTEVRLAYASYKSFVADPERHRSITDNPDGYDKSKNFNFSVDKNLLINTMVSYIEREGGDKLVLSIFKEIKSFMGNDLYDRKIMSLGSRIDVKEAFREDEIDIYTNLFRDSMMIDNFVDNFGLFGDIEEQETVYAVSVNQNNLPFQNVRIPKSMLREGSGILNFVDMLTMNYGDLINKLTTVKVDHDLEVFVNKND